jgi:hypothetical protein
MGIDNLKESKEWQFLYTIPYTGKLRRGGQHIAGNVMGVAQTQSRGPYHSHDGHAKRERVWGL